MNKCVANIFFFLLSCVFAFRAEAQEQEIRLQVTDEDKVPLLGVYVLNPVQHFLYTTTDENGECVFTAEAGASVQFATLGFEVQTFKVEELAGKKVIRLQSKAFALDEVQALGLSPEAILKKAAATLKCPKKKQPYQYYGNGQYEKITECLGKAVEYRREYGCYFSRGLTERLDVLDMDGEDQFIPAYVKRTYNLSPNGKDTLKILVVTESKDKRGDYQAPVRKVFFVMRATELYGPLFSNLKYYDFWQIPDDSDYVFTFQTKLKAYPDKSYIFGKGTVRIDRETFHLKSITFDYLDYQFYRLYRYKRHGFNSPFSTQAELTFEYDQEEVCHIHSCVMTTVWKHYHGNGYWAGEAPSRRNPAKNRLVEKEAFLAQSFERIPAYTVSYIQWICSYAGAKMKGEYDPAVWKNIPELLDSRQALQDLGQYMDVETQFRRMSNRSYRPEVDYEIGYPKNYSKLDAYQKYILDNFFKDIKP